MGKHVLSTDISSSKRQPYTQRTHIHYNDMITEAVQSLAKMAMPNVNTTDFYVLYGCVNSASPNANVSAGAIYFNGEIYLCDVFVDGTISNDIVGTITTTYAAGDPVLFTDNNTYNVHQIKKIVWSDAVSGTGSVDFADLKRGQALTKNSVIREETFTITTTAITTANTNQMTITPSATHNSDKMVISASGYIGATGAAGIEVSVRLAVNGSVVKSLTFTLDVAAINYPFCITTIAPYGATQVVTLNIITSASTATLQTTSLMVDAVEAYES